MTMVFLAPTDNVDAVLDYALEALSDAGLPRLASLIAGIEHDGYPDLEGMWPYRIRLATPVLTPPPGLLP